MNLIASRNQVSLLLGVCPQSVDALLHQGRLERVPGNRHVKITLRSLSAYTHLPLELVLQALTTIEQQPSNAAEAAKSATAREAQAGCPDAPPSIQHAA